MIVRLTRAAAGGVESKGRGRSARDEVAEALAKPADAQVVLEAIRAAEKVEGGG
jgi:hypothetical protein